ncbi:hypothetical protein HELRODRAFT_107587 [Helobdella robusta]|uniref:tRNA-dihydrouridine synthase n=1 Tax=Helobdella robusta TaxID=6412 RepID=T1EEB6_HELRO|nr:hypothetical protein HELRODRAFT_107587 [Helobdella robusta]ESN96557.1 hypothetical protein HELRODRAFT_107587 [Helobdella robusta]
MSVEENKFKNSMELFESKDVVKICAPMVRYSSLPFRLLVRKYGCDLAYTPMIIADSFVKSEKARANDFVTNLNDRPLVVQFAANDASVFAEASAFVINYADGVDLNCGCPQRWAMRDGYGCCLLKKPELMEDIVKTLKNRIHRRDFSISVKIRLLHDLGKTIEICRRMERIGCSWITVHARTPDQKHQPANWDPLKDIVDSLKIPVVANGDIKSMNDVTKVVNVTGVKGVMSARGLLGNPALYNGCERTPKECVQDWVNLAAKYSVTGQRFHNHLIYMLEKSLTKDDRKFFNCMTSTTDVLDFLEDNFGVSRKYDLITF